MPTRSEVIRARRRAVGGRRPRCRRGKSCSAACINQNKYCLVDAPTPVEGALPRAVKAIQTRSERLGRKEKKQVLEKRREYVKGKVRESTDLRQQKTKYKKQVNGLRVQIQRAFLSGDSLKERQLTDKLKRMESEVGSKLNLPKSKPIEAKGGGSIAKAKTSFKKKMMLLEQKMRSAANPSDPKLRPDRNLYDSLEKKLLNFAKKDSFLWDRHDGYMRTLKTYRKGKYWDMAKMDRNIGRQSKLIDVYKNVKNEAKQAAEKGDKVKYEQAEKKLLKIAERAGDKMKLTQLPTKGSLWAEVRVPKVLKSLRDSMGDALSAGDLNKYGKLEDKFLRVKNAYLKGDKGYNRKNDLFSLYGSSILSITEKGQLLEQYVDQLKRDAFRAANLRNRREYNNLENKLLKLAPSFEKGSIWKERVQSRVKDYIPKLRRGMRDAAMAKDRKKYNKLERALLRLDPDATKGKIWRETRVAGYLPTVRERLRAEAIEGNRREYDKWERVLFRMNRDNPSENIKGKVWRQERVGGAISKLAEDMEKAAREGNRSKYDRLEDRFFRIKNKVGNDAIRDADLRYMSRGSVWREVERSKPLEGMQAMLEKDKRKGVESIKVKGDPDDFSVVSKVLGNKVELKVSPNDTTSFLVNDSYTASGTLSKREEFAITREVMRQYGEIVKQMPDGTVFYVTAASGDGREEMREQAYVKFGFSDPDYNGQMYGMVRNGKMTPIDEDDYRMAKAGGYDDDDYED